MAAVVDRLQHELAAKLADASEAVTQADVEASKAAATREAAQASVNEFEAIMRPIEARAHAQGKQLAPFLRTEREATQRALKAAKTNQAGADKNLEFARAALAELQLAEQQLAVGQSSGLGGGPSKQSASRNARPALHQKGAQAAILSTELAHAR